MPLLNVRGHRRRKVGRFGAKASIGERREENTRGLVPATVGTGTN